MILRGTFIVGLVFVLKFFFHGNIISTFDIPWDMINNIIYRCISFIQWLCYFSDLFLIHDTLRNVILFGLLTFSFALMLRFILFVYNLISG